MISIVTFVQEEPYFTWTTHCALGGCCSFILLVNLFSQKPLLVRSFLRWKRRLGSYHFSCQFLNYPIDPSKCRINMADPQILQLRESNRRPSNP